TIADRPDVAAVEHVVLGRLWRGQPSRPAQLVRESIGALERKRLTIDAVALVLVERSCVARCNRRDADHRLVAIAESAAKLDVASRHSTQVRAVILGDE